MKYINWYEKDCVLHTGDGKEVTVLKLNSQNDDEILDEFIYQGLPNLDGYEFNGFPISKELINEEGALDDE